MIVKEYSAMINFWCPVNYFERWYIDIWDRHATYNGDGERYVDQWTSVLAKEFGHYGVTAAFDHLHNTLIVTYPSQETYSWIVLRWS